MIDAIALAKAIAAELRRLEHDQRLILETDWQSRCVKPAVNKEETE